MGPTWFSAGLSQITLCKGDAGHAGIFIGITSINRSEVRKSLANHALKWGDLSTGLQKVSETDQNLLVWAAFHTPNQSSVTEELCCRGSQPQQFKERSGQFLMSLFHPGSR